MRVLVTFGSSRGGTEGLAGFVADVLAAQGFHVDVRPAAEVKSLDEYDAVVVGGALYAMRWHRDAIRFVRRHHTALSARPTWFFSSGPLDASASDHTIPPVKTVARLMHQVGARGHMTFGGRLRPDAKGFMAAKIAKKSAGDWRDHEQVDAWADAIAADLREGARRAS